MWSLFHAACPCQQLLQGAWSKSTGNFFNILEHLVEHYFNNYQIAPLPPASPCVCSLPPELGWGVELLESLGKKKASMRWAFALTKRKGNIHSKTSGMAEQDLVCREVLNTVLLLEHYYVMDTKPRRRLLKVCRDPHDLDSVLLIPATSDKNFQLTAQHPCPCRDTCPFSFTWRHANQGREIFLMYTWYVRGGISACKKTFQVMYFGEQNPSASSCPPRAAAARCCSVQAVCWWAGDMWGMQAMLMLAIFSFLSFIRLQFCSFDSASVCNKIY